MVNTNAGRSFPRRTVYVATAFALLAVVAGFGIAASFTVTSGPALAGSGEYHATNSIAWWTESDVGVSVQPTVLPTAASATVGSPTVLVAGTNYGVNAPVANDVSQYWRFTEATTVTINTELELSFTVSTGAGPTITTLTVYIETQAAAPGAAVVFGFYYDLGNAVTTTITLNSVTEISQQCSVVGTCP
jgi:hypothetical protein